MKETGCERSPVESLMDVNSGSLLFAILPFQTLWKQESETVSATKVLTD